MTYSLRHFFAHYLLLFFVAIFNVLVSLPVQATPGEIIRLSEDSEGLPSISGGTNHANYINRFSNDGRYFVYSLNGVYLYDRVLKTSVPVSVHHETGAIAGGEYPTISADGRFIAYESYDGNITTENIYDNTSYIYVFDRLTGENQLVNKSTEGVVANAGSHSQYPAISADGRYVVFQSSSYSLVSNDDNGKEDVFIRDLQLGVTSLVSLDLDSAPADSPSDQANISGDGRYVFYRSSASNMAANITGSGLYVRDMQESVNLPISVDMSGELVSAYSPSVSSSGQYIVFQSSAPNITNDSTGSDNCYVKNLLTNETALVNKTLNGAVLSIDSATSCSLSGNARYVAFTVAGDNSEFSGQVVFKDLITNQLFSVSANADGINGNDTSNYPSVSYDGLALIFVSNSTNLVSGLQNGVEHLYFKEVSPVIRSVDPGSYSAEVSLLLSCSSCESIYYSLTDIAAESAGEYTIYSGEELLINSDVKLWAYQVSLSGISSTPQFGVYIIDGISPSLAIESPVNQSLLDGLSVITGTSSDIGGADIETIKLKISGADDKGVQSQGGGLVEGDPQWVTASTTDNWINWSYDTSTLNWSPNTYYTIEARATDGAGNQTTSTHTFGHAIIVPDYTTLEMGLSSSSIKFNENIDVSLKLTNPADPSEDFSNTSVSLVVTDPDGTTSTLGPYSLNSNGQATVSDLGDGSGISFNQKGTWTIQAVFDGTDSLLESSTDPQILLVGSVAGYAVIIQGKVSGGEGEESHNKSTNRVYQTLIDRGFVDQNIFYFNHDPTQDANGDGFADNDPVFSQSLGVDYVPTQSTIQQVIEGLSTAMNNNPAPLYVIMVDHGSSDHRFLLSPTENITPTELDGWLDTLEGNLDVEAAKEPRVVVIGACYSGGFLPQLKGQNRLIVASAAANEESYKGALESDGIRVGEYFVEEFFQELAKGTNFRAAFAHANNKVRDYTRKGGSNSDEENEYFDDSAQHPLLDDDGDGKGTHRIDIKTSDGGLAKGLILGKGPNYDVNSLANPADIVAVTGTLIIGNGQSTADLFLTPNFSAEVQEAIVEVRVPTQQLAAENGTVQLETNYDRRFMVPPVDPQISENFTLTYDGFSAAGKYEIYYYVEDQESKALSPAKRSVVYKKLSTDSQPSAFDLVAPANNDTVKTVVGFDWEDSSDTQGLTYTLEIADDSGFTQFNGVDGIYKLEEIKSSSAFVDATAGLKDLSTYYWRVKAIDNYGAVRLSTQTWSFDTNNNNAPYGILKGIVHSDVDFSRIASAKIKGVIGSYTDSVFAEFDGEYILLLPPGLAQITTSKTGFANKLFSNIDIPVSTVDNPFVTLNIPMSLPPDTDGDGLRDDVDTDDDNDGLSDTAETQTYNTDPLKKDTDGDGMDDKYEVDNGLNPNANDANSDKDGDGYTNLEEYEGGSSANDPSDVPKRGGAWRAVIPYILSQ